jgi:DNA-binding NtrC family response regulator
VDAVITDLEMAGVSGFQVIEELHAERPKLPVFAWTFHEDPQVAVRATTAGARSCINKMKREELMKALAENGMSLRRSTDQGANHEHS